MMQLASAIFTALHIRFEIAPEQRDIIIGQDSSAKLPA